MRLRRRQSNTDPQPEPQLSEVELAQRHVREANADLYERNRERYEPTGPASPEELAALAEAEAADQRDFHTGAPQPRYLTLPEDLRMSPRERKLAIYEELERRIEVKRERLKHAASGARRSAEKNLERMEEQHDRLHAELFPCVDDEGLAQHAQTFKKCKTEGCEEQVDSAESYAQAGRCRRCFWLAQNADRLPPRDEDHDHLPTDPF